MAADSTMGFHQGITASLYNHHMLWFQSNNDVGIDGGDDATGGMVMAPGSVSGGSGNAGLFLSPNTGVVGNAPGVAPSRNSSGDAFRGTGTPKYKYVTGSPSDWSDCEVGDFGLSRIKRNTQVSGGVCGTLPWMAPELLNGSSNKWRGLLRPASSLIQLQRSGFMSEREDRGEGHARRPSRSSSFGGHRGGGVGGAGKGGAGSLGQPPLSSNRRGWILIALCLCLARLVDLARVDRVLMRTLDLDCSIRKPGNGHGRHQRVVNQPDTTGYQPAPAPGLLQTPARSPPAPQNAAMHVPVSASWLQHQDPHVSSSLSASEKPANPLLPLPKATHAAPRALPKNSNTALPQGGSQGETSKGFNFQFGSINMNGLPQFPARTSSTPPNLDEQKLLFYWTARTYKNIEVP
ncbi:hypothetical protein ZEAMMB73_Zm00001d029873 [Zea mays]|uniref:Uncharacterized protein n=1 Tax=Zea mays TaxID=4577 RepID=A0A1D6K896_MAIZE|nr:hypothetical protein ZEAMMB73_Zm00001d029873 [Zea mays]